MPVNYPNCRFVPTDAIRDALAEQGLTLQQAIEVIQGPGASWEGRRPHQMWHRGTTGSGRELKVLVEFDLPAKEVKLITAHDVQAGG